MKANKINELQRLATTPLLLPSHAEFCKDFSLMNQDIARAIFGVTEPDFKPDMKWEG
jgi:hypothetical protein